MTLHTRRSHDRRQCAMSLFFTAEGELTPSGTVLSQTRFSRAQLRQDNICLSLLQLLGQVLWYAPDVTSKAYMIFASAACGRDIYTMLLSAAADKHIATDLYDLCMALWDGWQHSACPRPRWVRPDRTVILAFGTPFSSRARYTMQPIPMENGILRQGSAVAVLTVLTDSHTDHANSGIGCRFPSALVLPTTEPPGSQTPSAKEYSGVVFACPVFVRPGPPTAWDTRTERAARFANCLCGIRRLLKPRHWNLPVVPTQIHFERAIGDEISAANWPAWESEIHLFANSVNIGVTIHL